MQSQPLIGTLEKAHRVGTEVCCVHRKDAPVQLHIAPRFLL
jgi:hypothetical protein